MAIQTREHNRNGWKIVRNLVEKFENKRYWGGYAEWDDGKRVYDADVAKYVKKHLKFIDRFDIRKVSEATLYAFSILSGSVEPPKENKWKF